MARDWKEWHTAYDDPESSLARRLEVVRTTIREVLGELSHEPHRPRRLVSLCAGDGRDVLPVLRETGTDVDALLVELDRGLADAAAATARQLGLDRVVVRNGDAGSTDTYRGWAPADVVLAAGVFGNITDDDLVRTVATLPTLLTAGGLVVWTRGSNVPQDPTTVEGDPSEHVRRVFAAHGFEERTFVRPDDAGFRVGVHRLVETPAGFTPGVQMFTFV